MTSFFMRLSKSWDCALLFSSHQSRASKAPTAHCLLAAFHFLISSSSSTHEIFTGFIILKNFLTFKILPSASHWTFSRHLSGSHQGIRQLSGSLSSWRKDVDVLQSLATVQPPGSHRAAAGQSLQYIEVGLQPPSEDNGANNGDSFEDEESFFGRLFLSIIFLNS